MHHLLCTSSWLHALSIAGRNDFRKDWLLQMQLMSVSWQPVDEILVPAACCCGVFGVSELEGKIGDRLFGKQWRLGS